MNEIIQAQKNNILQYLEELGDKSKSLFDNKAYLELINLINSQEPLIKSYSSPVTNIFCLNEKFVPFIYQGLAYIEIAEYKSAIDIFLLIENDYENLLSIKKYYKTLNKKSSNDSEIFKEVFDAINEQITNVRDNLAKTFSNLAFAYYKLKDYENSIKYYKKAIYRDKKNPQFHMELSQAQYRHIEQKSKKIKWFHLKEKQKLKTDKNKQKECYLKTINLLKKQETSFETLLSIGKLLYFLGDYNSALNYIQNAVDYSIANKDSSIKIIFAYDWLSRIAYKEKRYAVAANFYEKIIDNIISNNESISENGIIHQKPKLSDMVRYLNETKDLVSKGETRNIEKTIWAGIITGIILETAEIYSSKYSFKIPFFMFIILFLASIMFIKIWNKMFKN